MSEKSSEEKEKLICVVVEVDVLLNLLECLVTIMN